MSPKEIDVDYFLGVMRAVSPIHTRHCTICSVPQTSSPSADKLSLGEAFLRISNGASDLLTWLGHEHSTEIRDKSVALHRSAPLSICIVGGLYFHRILGFKIWNASDSIETRLFRRELLILKRDVHGLEEDLQLGKTSRDLWLIKVLCAVLGMDIVRQQAGPEFMDDFDETQFWSLRSWYIERICFWVSITGITEWTEAKKTFRIMLGDQTFPRERHAKSIWHDAMARFPQDVLKAISSPDEIDSMNVDPWRMWRSKTAFFTV